MIISAIFVAIFLNKSEGRCVPPSALGAPLSADALIAVRLPGSKTDMAISKALAAAAKFTPSPSEQRLEDDALRYCRAKGLDLLRDRRDDNRGSSGSSGWILDGEAREKLR